MLCILALTRRRFDSKCTDTYCIDDIQCIITDERIQECLVIKQCPVIKAKVVANVETSQLGK